MSKRVVLSCWLLATSLAFAYDKQQSWLKLQSPHFLIMTDGSEQARHAAGQFERMRLVFHTQFPEMPVDPDVPIVVIATKNEKDFRALEPQDYLGKGKLQLAGLFCEQPTRTIFCCALTRKATIPMRLCTTNTPT